VNQTTISDTQRKSNAELVMKAQQGDPEAFETLFNLHKAKVYSLCLRMTTNVAEAEDLTQDAFLQVFRKLSTFRNDSAFSTWLYRLTVNTVLMHFRKKRMSEVSLDQPSTADSGNVKEYGRTDGRLSKSVERIALGRALRKLPQGYRNIFVLHEIQGYDHREIARRLECSVGNSKSQLHKAKMKMRELFEVPPGSQSAMSPQAAMTPTQS
jgi:RNA polymerase sigma-70 factor (ECF subfamily)